MKILIAVPTFETITPETFKSIYGLIKPDGVYTQFDFVKGYDCARARNLIAKEAIEHGFDYVLMVDSDIVLPSDTLVSFLTDPKDICLGLYPKKNTSSELVEITKLGERDFTTFFTFGEVDLMSGKFEVHGGGFGCAFIKVSVFERMVYPFFKYVEYPDGNVLSEDNYFCNEAAKVGFNIWADPKVHCSHLKRQFQWR